MAKQLIFIHLFIVLCFTVRILSQMPVGATYIARDRSTSVSMTAFSFFYHSLPSGGIYCENPNIFNHMYDNKGRFITYINPEVSSIFKDMQSQSHLD